MSYLNTRMKDSFTEEEIRKWRVKPYMHTSLRFSARKPNTNASTRVHATWVYHPEKGVSAYRYHYTDIVTFTPTEFTIDTGGHTTRTTYKHINEIIPWGRLWSRRTCPVFSVFGITVPVEERLILPLNCTDFITPHLPYGVCIDITLERDYFKVRLGDLSLWFSSIKDVPQDTNEFKLKAVLGN